MIDKEFAHKFIHDIKNPLATIIQGVDFLKVNLKGGDANTAKVLKIMEDAVRKAEKIAQDLLNFTQETDK